MKAAFVIEPGRFEIREVPMPTISDNEILVKVEAVGVCSSDMSKYKDSLSEEMKKLLPLPRRLGHEPAGTIVEVGKNIQNFQAGDRVTGYLGDECYSEYVAFDITNKIPRGHGYIVEKIPDGIPFEYALGEPLMSLVSIARTASPEFGDYVFQVGCGFMGLGVIAGTAHPKLREYIVCDLDESRLELAKDLGATITLNPSKVDVVKEVMKITQNRGVDVAIESVGNPASLKLAGEVIKRRGKMIVVGWHQAPNTYELFSWIKSPIIYSPQGIGMSTDPQSELQRAMWALEKGIYPMEKLVTHKYKLENINDAFTDSLKKTPGHIKGVVMPFMK